MKQKLLTILHIAMLIISLYQIGTAITMVADIKYSHYEDGSGKITYCLPWGSCN